MKDSKMTFTIESSVNSQRLILSREHFGPFPVLAFLESWSTILSAMQQAQGHLIATSLFWEVVCPLVGHVK